MSRRGFEPKNSSKTIMITHLFRQLDQLIAQLTYYILCLYLIIV